MQRPSWDRQALDIAAVVARRSTCERAIEKYGGVGAVVTDQRHRVLGTGYCGSLPGLKHCTEVGCLIIAPDPGCQRTMHAEWNAILNSPKDAGPKTLYSTVSPCLKCLQLAIGWGVIRVVFTTLYRNSEWQVQLAAEAGVEWCHLPAVDFPDEETKPARPSVMPPAPTEQELDRAAEAADVGPRKLSEAEADLMQAIAQITGRAVTVGELDVRFEWRGRDGTWNERTIEAHPTNPAQRPRLITALREAVMIARADHTPENGIW